MKKHRLIALGLVLIMLLSVAVAAQELKPRTTSKYGTKAISTTYFAGRDANDLEAGGDYTPWMKLGASYSGAGVNEVQNKENWLFDTGGDPITTYRLKKDTGGNIQIQFGDSDFWSPKDKSEWQLLDEWNPPKPAPAPAPKTLIAKKVEAPAQPIQKLEEPVEVSGKGGAGETSNLDKKKTPILKPPTTITAPTTYKKDTVLYAPQGLLPGPGSLFNKPIFVKIVGETSEGYQVVELDPNTQEPRSEPVTFPKNHIENPTIFVAVPDGDTPPTPVKTVPVDKATPILSFGNVKDSGSQTKNQPKQEKYYLGVGETGGDVYTEPVEGTVEITKEQYDFIKANQNGALSFEEQGGKIIGISAQYDNRKANKEGKLAGTIVTKGDDETEIVETWTAGERTRMVSTSYDNDGTPDDYSDDVRVVLDIDPKTADFDTATGVIYERYVTTDDGKTRVRASNKPIGAVLPSGAELDYETGNINGRSASDFLKGASDADKAAYRQLKNKRRNWRIADTLEAVRFYGTEYTGLSGFSSLFFDEEALSDWRRTVEETFCDTILLGGVDCWTSQVCEAYSDAAPGPGTFIGEGPDGEPVNIAHIEASRSAPATFFNQTGGQQTTEYLYKITYFIKNPEDEEDLEYNLVFKPQGYVAFNQDKVLKDDSTASASGNDAIVQYSKNLYTEVCLTFKPAIKGFAGETATEVCNTICGGIIDPITNACKPLETANWSPPGAAEQADDQQPTQGEDWDGF